MNQYDAIFVGSNIGNLVCAYNLRKANLKVLIVDINNSIDYDNSTFKLGRFEFNKRIHNILSSNYSFTNMELVKSKIKVVINKKHFIIEGNLERFIDTIDESIPNSRKNLDELFRILKEIKNNNSEYIDRFGRMHVTEGIMTISVEGELRELLLGVATYLGTDNKKISFIDYGMFLLSLFDEEIYVPKYSSSVSMELLDKYLSIGGKIKLNTKVDKILVDDNIINGIKLSDGMYLYTNRLIVDSSLSNLDEYIDDNDISKEERNKVFSFYIGIDGNINTDSNIWIIDDYFKVYSLICYVTNNTISIHVLFKDNYDTLIDQDVIILEIIKYIEDIFNIEIYDYIEELKISSIEDNLLNIEDNYMIDGLYINNEFMYDKLISHGIEISINIIGGDNHE